MKIVEINSCNFGSTGNIMIDLSNIMEEQGHIVYTACPDGRSMRKKKLKRHMYIGNIAERNLHIRLAYRSGKIGFYSQLGTKLFLRKIDKINPDIIHLHNLHNSYINIEMLFNYIKRNKTKVIWTLHDCWSFTGHCPHFEIVNCDKWETECYDCPQYREYPQSKIDNSKFMYHLKKEWFTGVESLTIVTPSEWLGILVRRSFLKEYPVKVINNGINLNIFKPTQSNFRQKNNCKDKIILLGVAFNWGKRKGLDVFVELSARLDEKYQIVLVGTDDNIDMQLPQNIISIHKTQNQTELAEIYTAADIFINPTREEVFGLVNIESLACGTPVITFNTGGSPECIDNTCGVVVEKDDIDGIISAISQLTEQNIGSDLCIKRAALFNNNKKYEEYVDLYKKVSK